jgi:hypothetical protein
VHSRHLRTIALCAGLLALGSTPTDAHDAHVIGPYRLSIGWAEEPAFAGMRNAIVVKITNVATRAPVEDLGGGSLTAELSFGSERVVLPLQQAWGERNTWRAWVLPTRPGTYTFHITGSVKSDRVDITTTCSDKTFDCVASATEIQFPAKDPSAAQMVERIDRSLPRADRALESAARAQLVAFAALLASAVAVVASVWLGSRRKKDV